MMEEENVVPKGDIAYGSTASVEMPTGRPLVVLNLLQIASSS